MVNARAPAEKFNFLLGLKIFIIKCNLKKNCMLGTNEP